MVKTYPYCCLLSPLQSLCSWDPCKRPTASEALQHPFFQVMKFSILLENEKFAICITYCFIWQSCFYVPPSLRPKTALAKTPPSGQPSDNASSVCYIHDGLSISIEMFFSIAAGSRIPLEQRSGRRYSGTLPSVKPMNNSPKPRAPLHAGEF